MEGERLCGVRQPGLALMLVTCSGEAGRASCKIRWDEARIWRSIPAPVWRAAYNVRVRVRHTQPCALSLSLSLSLSRSVARQKPAPAKRNDRASKIKATNRFNFPFWIEIPRNKLFFLRSSSLRPLVICFSFLLGSFYSLFLLFLFLWILILILKEKREYKRRIVESRAVISGD